AGQAITALNAGARGESGDVHGVTVAILIPCHWTVLFLLRRASIDENKNGPESFGLSLCSRKSNFSGTNRVPQHDEADSIYLARFSVDVTVGIQSRSGGIEPEHGSDKEYATHGHG
ncbi:hypothetical protein OQA87_22505, partial [Yersinia intermedia]|uniref:hypothetical protein n=1 Tax=Yersinia intermedia TaxID=631 RepID=UPI0022435005